MRVTTYVLRSSAYRVIVSTYRYVLLDSTYYRYLDLPDDEAAGLLLFFFLLNNSKILYRRFMIRSLPVVYTVVQI